MLTRVEERQFEVRATANVHNRYAQLIFNEFVVVMLRFLLDV